MTRKNEAQHEPARWLTEWRERHGIGVMALADHLGVDRQTIWYWETGRARPNRKLVGLALTGLLLQLAQDRQAQADNLLAEVSAGSVASEDEANSSAV